MFKNYFKTVWRNLLRNKMTSFINIGGLSIGMMAAVFIFMWVENELSFDRYHKDADNIYRITTNVKATGWIWETTPLLLAGAIKKEVPEVNLAARLYHGNMPVFNIQQKPLYDNKCAYIDASWFDIFHYEFLRGSAASFAEDPNSIILTAANAKKYFGNIDVIGTTIQVDSTDLVIKGIVRDPPANSSFQYSSFISLSNFLKDPSRRENDEQWGNANYLTFIKTTTNANPVSVEKKITSVFASLSGDKDVNLTLSPLKQMHFDNTFENSVYAHSNRQTVYIFTLLAVLLLVIACINYVNLTTAKASLRAKEVSVRKIIGANKSQLFFQFIAEALLINFVALLVTILLVQLFLPLFNTVTNKAFTISIIDASVWKVIGITLTVAIGLTSLYPALTLSSFKPLNVFRGFTLLKVKDSYFRKGLVVIQFAISILLIAGTIVIYKQMQFIQQTNPGYNKSQLLTFYLPPDVNQDTKGSLIAAIKQDLISKSVIQNVAVSNQRIFDVGSYSSGSADWNGRDSTFNPKIAQLSVDADYAKTMQLEMKEGRWFEQGNAADMKNVVLNETAINELDIPEPFIGQRFVWKGNEGQIIGIVRDFKYRSLHDKVGPLVAFANPNWFNVFMVRIAPKSVPQAIAEVQKTLRKFFPANPIDYSFIDEGFNQLYKTDRQTSQLIFVFALIAIFISSLGLFALATFTAAQRAKEIGIRKVLGATVVGISQLLTKSFMKLVLVAVIIACPVAWVAMDKWLQRFAYRIDIDLWIFLTAGSIALLIALATISFQAIRAAIANPVKSLRTE